MLLLTVLRLVCSIGAEEGAQHHLVLKEDGDDWGDEVDEAGADGAEAGNGAAGGASGPRGVGGSGRAWAPSPASLDASPTWQREHPALGLSRIRAPMSVCGGSELASDMSHCDGRPAAAYASLRWHGSTLFKPIVKCKSFIGCPLLS